MSALRHQILEDGRVYVRLGDHGAHVADHEVKRFAWAVLNDLDPDEASGAGYVAAPIILCESDSREQNRRGPWQLVAILAALVSGPKNTRQIATAADTTRTQAAIQLGRLEKRGCVLRARRGAAHWPAVWSITDGGAAFLRDQADAAQ